MNFASCRSADSPGIRSSTDDDEASL